ncbi:ShlB/FhaC/HecB family hemolysin secretion/activation protein [Coralloluteibacterium thermophilus]|uniref:ShlB/FhaC/HecB family hemolysin secretion/activation protein n=1 Tax=Coralloluteibacterium thermophilum TaxID=2707049 RepID=A0ABV9NS71_9GAMM
MSPLALFVAACLPCAAVAQSGGVALPSVAERGYVADPTIEVRGFRVLQVGEHPDSGITAETMQALADARFAALAGGQPRATLSFDQLQEVAAAITAAYRDAGFIVSTAYLPEQTVEDGIVEIHVLEGRVGRVVVQGAGRYRPGTIAAPLERLQGRILSERELKDALLYARDLPGVSVSSVLQPGEAVGETDIVVVAREADRPVTVSVGANNYGTDLTGRYRAQLGLAWTSPLGIGDAFNLSYAHAFDPSQSRLGALSYSVPVRPGSGVSGILGYSRSELQVRSGSFGALGITGPTSIAYAGGDWKFVNRDDLQMQTSLRYIRERSRLSALGFALSDQEFDVVEAGFTLRRIDTRWRGVDLLQTSLRRAVQDRSLDPDLITPERESDFLVARASYARMQYLSRTQRLLLRLGGQYSRDPLVPMEQFSVGGPDSVRAFGVSEGLGDRGYHAAFEYHVDAPGFAGKTSPFGGRPWRELLEFELFVDHARVLPAAGVRGDALTLQGAGAGLTFRLPDAYGFEFRLAAATPVGGTRSPDGDDLRVWARLGMTF